MAEVTVSIICNKYRGQRELALCYSKTSEPLLVFGVPPLTVLMGNQTVDREAIDSEHGRYFPFLVLIMVNAQAQSVCDSDQEMGDSVSSPLGTCPFRRDIINSSVRWKGKCKCLDRSQCLHVQAQLRQSLDRNDKFCMLSQGEL